MRISIMKEDRDFVPDGENYEVTLDGVKQTQCISADSDKGEIARYKVNGVGIPCVNRSGKFIVEVLSGNVVINKVPRAT